MRILITNSLNIKFVHYQLSLVNSLILFFPQLCECFRRVIKHIFVYFSNFFTLNICYVFSDFGANLLVGAVFSLFL